MLGRHLPTGIALAAAALASTAATPAGARFEAAQYHWPRTSTPVRVQVGDNVDSRWDSALRLAVADWNKSTFIDSPLVPGTSAGNCKGVAGTIQVCNSSYGRNGWLSLTSVGVSGASDATEATIRLNDSYFASAPFGHSSRTAALCRAIGHSLGLADVPAAASAPVTSGCMSPDSWTGDQHQPGAQSYAALESLYGQVSQAGSMLLRANGAGAFPEVGEEMASWGEATQFDSYGRPQRFERMDEPGLKTITYVSWAPGEGPRQKFRIARR